MTFGARNELGASAPGQIEVGKLKNILNIIEK
jgi:3-dehydroquinate dehydratase